MRNACTRSDHAWLARGCPTGSSYTAVQEFMTPSEVNGTCLGPRFVSWLLTKDHPAVYYLNLMAISTDHDVLDFLSPAAINCQCPRG